MINKNELENKINEYMETKYKNYIDVLENEIDNQLIKNNGKAYIDKFKFVSLIQDAKNKYSFKVFNNSRRGFILVGNKMIIETISYFGRGMNYFLKEKEDNIYGNILKYIVEKYYSNGYDVKFIIDKGNYNKLTLRIQK